MAAAISLADETALKLSSGSDFNGSEKFPSRFSRTSETLSRRRWSACEPSSAGFFPGLHFGMSGSLARLRVNLLSFFTDGPANPEECGIGMRGSLHHHRRAADFA